MEFLSTVGGAAPGFTMPMRWSGHQMAPDGTRGSPRVENGGAFSVRRSKDDVLLEEIQFLRQMLADCNEEKRIQAANAV